MTATENIQAWVALEEASLSAFGIRIAGGRNDFGTIKPGDWVVVVDVAGTLRRIGRILRVRADLGSTTLYFGHLHVLRIEVRLADVGLTIPAETISRLRSEHFANILARDGISTPADVPPIKEAAYLRSLLRDAIADDLLGPADGPKELIVGMSVRDRYLVGRLAPKEAAETGDTAFDAAAQRDDPEDATKKTGQHVPGEDFEATGSDTDPDEQEFDASTNQSRIPSSFGLTCCVDQDTPELLIDASWGRYQRTPEQDVHEPSVDKETGEPRLNPRTGEQIIAHYRTWQRHPSGGIIRINLPKGEGVIPPTRIDPDIEGVTIQGVIRPPMGDGVRMLTLFLVNGQPLPDENQDEAWIFQPELALRHPDGKAVFCKRPVLGGDAQDQERVALEMIYRDRIEFAVGHGVSVHADPNPGTPERSAEVRTVVMPSYEVPITEVPGKDKAKDRPAMHRIVAEGLLDMRRLAAMGNDEVLATLAILVDDYRDWIADERKRVPSLGRYQEAGGKAMDRCQAILDRLLDGLKTLKYDADARRAFAFANQVMADQRVRSIYALKRRRNENPDLAAIEKERSSHEWRPFQLAFLLLSIPALTDPHHGDRTEPVAAHADLLWFPTGGGKTEAYLGVAAFAMGIRRLKKDLGGLDGSRGLSVIMRYTLRLLTLQQFQRASTLICAMEAARRDDPATWGETPFTIGLWVGKAGTPNATEDAWQYLHQLRNGQRTTGSSPAQLTSCPWCGSPIDSKRDIESDRDRLRTTMFCSDHQGCIFSQAKSQHLSPLDRGLPVLVVDEELYRRPPSMLIGTVDKFAMMAWRGEIRSLFGRADRECSRHGLAWPDCDCHGSHPADAKKKLDAVKVAPVKTRIRPPDLIIQDEFHLISGPLGTMVGLYETAVDELCSWPLPDGKGGTSTVRPKVIASSATVRRADDQVRNVFLRKVAVFPPHGLDVRDNFFSVQRPIEDRPGRRYVGICAPGSSRPAILIRVYTAMLTASQALFDHFGQAADPWMTAVGYFNSLRELGGMKRLAEDDVQTRCFRVAMSKVERPGLVQRSVKEVDELTSRVSSQDIPRKLDQLEVPFRAVFDPGKGRYVAQKAKKEDPNPIDVVLATNMLSVGVDVNRLGLMAVNGQPKSTAEYIQATSRVGRQFPGLVFTVLAWSRPRDLSHYETFEHYHATFYKHVEAQSATPFAPRALDRGLTGALVSLIRLGHDRPNPNLGAQTVDSVSLSLVAEAKQRIKDRGDGVTKKSALGDFARDLAAERLDRWVKEAQTGGRKLGYDKPPKQGDVAALLEKPGIKRWDWNTAPMSMREVEPGVRLVMDTTIPPEPPPWTPMPPEEKKPKGGKKGKGNA